MTEPRLNRIYEQASQLFINQGYEKTQISHIVKATGISTGAIYDLFVSKKAIYQFLVCCTINPELLTQEHQFPIREEDFPRFKEEVIQALTQVVEEFCEPLAAHKTRHAVYTYKWMLSDAFDLLSRYATGCLLFEANATAFPDLFAYYTAYRLQFYEAMVRYVQRFIRNGVLRPTLNPNHTAKFMIETLYWWAMHIHYHGFDPNEAIPKEQAKQICVDALLHAYQK